MRTRSESRSTIAACVVAVALIVALFALGAAADGASRQCRRDNAPGPGQYEADRRYGCTPGRYYHYSRDRVCASKDRPNLKAANRREILARYRLKTWTGADGELDHLVPFFLGGKTVPGNIWPQPHMPGETAPGSQNDKDRLEAYVRVRICVRRDMSVLQGRRIFMSDWRRYYQKFFG
jgi:hypothetical protein